jgi:hypothetical protein
MLITAAVVLCAVVVALGLSAWAKVRESDRFVDELAAGLPHDHPALDDQLVSMLTEWQHAERMRLIEAWFARPEGVDTPYRSERG